MQKTNIHTSEEHKGPMINIEDVIARNPDVDQELLRRSQELIKKVGRSGKGYNIVPPFSRRIPITPAMEAGVSKHVWGMEEIAELADQFHSHSN